MVSKVRGCLKAVKYMIFKGKSMKLNGLPTMERNARINLKKGTVEIGCHLSMKPNAYFAVVNGGSLTVGNNVHINRNCMVICHDSISIGSNCSFGPNTLIYDHDHKFDCSGLKSGFNTAPVEIENNCWIGAGVIILRGTHIGEGSVIGAGCIVKGDIPPHSLVTSDRKLSITQIEQR